MTTHQERAAQYHEIVANDPDIGISMTELDSQLDTKRDVSTVTLREEALVHLMGIFAKASTAAAKEVHPLFQNQVMQEMTTAGLQSLRVLGVTSREIAQAGFDYAHMMGLGDDARERAVELADSGSDSDELFYDVSSFEELMETLNQIGLGDKRAGS